MKTEVDLVDIGTGNVGSVRRALERLDIGYRNVGRDQLPDGSRPIVLPGVGSFGAYMRALDDADLTDTLKTLISSGTPYLGICVGMQILFDSSEESPGTNGLSILGGTVKRLQAPKVPQIGWNRIEPAKPNWEGGFVYFVNSFVAAPEDTSISLYSSEYGGTICAAVQRSNVTAFQFHPEKSGAFGAEMLKRWASNAN